MSRGALATTLAPVEASERYHELEPLAQGGMGVVYRATMRTETGVEKRVALKLVREDLAADPAFVEMFMGEARIAMAMSHANVVHSFDAGHLEGKPFLAMELVEGTDLGSLLDAGPLPLELALTVATEALKGLDYAHRLEAKGRPLGVVHRDVSPSNLLLSREGEVKVADFGIARGAAQRQREKGTRGKLRYMAPEQRRGVAVDARADLYGMGFVLRESVAEVDAELDGILEKATAEEPSARFQTAAEMREALERYARGHGVMLSTSALADHLRSEQVVATPGFDFGAALGGALGEAKVRTATVEVGEAETPAPSRAPLWIPAALVVLCAGVIVWRMTTPAPQDPTVPAPPTERATRAEPAPVVAREPEAASQPSVALAEPAPMRPRTTRAASRVAAEVGPAEAPGVAAEVRPVEAPGVAAEVGPAEAPGVAANEAPVPVEPGRLRVAADPWAWVHVDGTRIGRTTIRNHEVSPGSHEVVLRNPEAGLERRYAIDVAPGGTETISAFDWRAARSER